MTLKIKIRNLIAKYKEKIFIIFCKKEILLHCNLSSKINLSLIFQNKDYNKEYLAEKPRFNLLKIPDFSGGINTGDQKAIFFIIKEFKPIKVLEIGTHIGASTVNIAMAMNDCNINKKELTTVDILDVNNRKKKPWKKFNSTNSPKKNVEKLNIKFPVYFVKNNSIDFLKNTKNTYDFIFLDGLHQSDCVYAEIALSLKILNMGGMILVHDYYPEGKSLFEGKNPIHGPFEGVKRVIKENNFININPFYKLPWETKYKNHNSTLAMLYKVK